MSDASCLGHKTWNMPYSRRNKYYIGSFRTHIIGMCIKRGFTSTDIMEMFHFFSFPDLIISVLFYENEKLRFMTKRKRFNVRWFKPITD